MFGITASLRKSHMHCNFVKVATCKWSSCQNCDGSLWF